MCAARAQDADTQAARSAKARRAPAPRPEARTQAAYAEAPPDMRPAALRPVDSVGRQQAGVGQAIELAATGLKIETWTSSGSMTPKIFSSARRCTHEPQLSK